MKPNSSLHVSPIIIAVIGIMFAASVFAAEMEKRATTAKSKMTQEEIDDMYLEAVMLHKLGRYDDAEAKAKQIQAQLPDNPDIKQLLAEIARARKSQGDKRPGELKRILTEMIVPDVSLREAVAQDVILFLHDESAKLAKDKKAINFVWLVPADSKLPRVTLALKQIPMLDVLGYVTQMAGLRYRIEANAVVIYKETSGAAQPVSGDSSGSNVKSE